MSAFVYRRSPPQHARCVRSTDGYVPDLILRDLMMPGVHGWQVRVAQKQRSTLRALPVVAPSADTSLHAAAIDADAYVSKPVEFAQLTAVLSQGLSASQRSRAAEAARGEYRVQGLARLIASISNDVNKPLTYVLAGLDLASISVAALLSESGAASRAGRLATLGQSSLAARNGTLRIAVVVCHAHHVRQPQRKRQWHGRSAAYHRCGRSTHAPHDS
jgi:CheY-like chemotaxis protein